MNITVSNTVFVGPKEVQEIFDAVLKSYTGSCWIEGDKVMEEHYTSHRFDVHVGNVDDPIRSVQVAAIRLRMAIDARRENREDKK